MWSQIANGHAQLISHNPQPAVLERWGRERNPDPERGGFVPEPIENLGSWVVRFHQAGGGSAPVSEATTGIQERSSTWGCIMPANVPLRTTDGEDGTTRVIMTHPIHGQFRLRRLRSVEESGVRIGWQSDLERISGRFDLAPTQPSGGRPTLEADATWRYRMAAVDEYLAGHPESTASQAFRALDFPLPAERTLQAWRQRWRGHEEPQETLDTGEPAPAPSPRPHVRTRLGASG